MKKKIKSILKWSTISLSLSFIITTLAITGIFLSSDKVKFDKNKLTEYSSKIEFYDSENKIPPFCFNRKGEVYEPYDFRVKYQAIRDYGWSVTLAFDLMNEQ